jgi:hypothetical protein
MTSSRQVYYPHLFYQHVYDAYDGDDAFCPLYVRVYDSSYALSILVVPLISLLGLYIAR